MHALCSDKMARPFSRLFVKSCVRARQAFGKLKETHSIEHSRYTGMSDEDIQKRIKELQEKLGFQPSEPKILPPADDDPKVH